LVAPGAYSPLPAMIAEQTGFAAVYMTGYGTAAHVFGYPDVGLLTMSEMVANAQRIAQAVQVPVIADADTGYGNALNVQRTVREYETAGVAGIHIEDQQWPKKCGHMEGKRLIPAEEMVGKVRAALDARTDPDFVIIARCDANIVLGFEETIRRTQLYVEAGADMIFIDSPISREELVEIPKRVGAPVLVNMSEGGRTPMLTNDELEALGYAAVIWPTSSTLVVARAVQRVFAELREHGTTAGQLDDMLLFHDFNRLLGLSRIYELEARYKTG
jgi:carboxyvinyl-carboxyphosphonate phosphorylmutase